MTEPADNLAKFRAELDQSLAGMLELATTFSSYWNKLVSEGMSESAATALTVTLQHDLLENSRRMKDE